MTTNTTTVAGGQIEQAIQELMAEAEAITRNLHQNPDLVPDRIDAMDRIGRLSGAAKKLRKAGQIITEANRILATVTY